MTIEHTPRDRERKNGTSGDLRETFRRRTSSCDVTGRCHNVSQVLTTSVYRNVVVVVVVAATIVSSSVKQLLLAVIERTVDSRP